MTILAAIASLILAASEIDLAGEWRLSGTDEHGAALECPIAVPGDVHYALYKANLIPDPFWGCNETNVQWVGFRDWTISRDFDVSPDFLAAEEIVLRADDVDCFADISVNGRRIGSTCDRFLRWQFDVKPYLRVGSNTISAVFRSAAQRGDELAADFARRFSTKTNICRFEHEWVHHNEFVRKNACHKGWDWGPSQMVTGFCGPVRLVASRKGRRVEYVYADTKFNDDMSHCTLTAYAEMSDGSVVTNVVEIDDPPLWWPAGQGEQRFYEYTMSVDGETTTRCIGLRKVEVDCSDGGMAFKVNGRPIFMKGANWIPCSAYENEQTPERYRDLLESAKAANMNMVRLWGGGQYEKDCFYDICDELGLLVWHDQMFACGVYPVEDPAFADLVARECAHQFRRLRDHASIALWCGGNECKAPVSVIKAMSERYDPSRMFWPSSPCAGPDDLSGTTFGRADAGDSHNWQVWHSGKPLTEYYKSRPRFCSEFGFQSFSSPEVAATFCDISHSQNPEFEWHQKNEGGNDRIRNSFARDFRAPKDFESTLYLSQVQQAFAIKTAVEGWRAQRPHGMGTLYWQLNDIWPVASWSSLEYGGPSSPGSAVASKWKHLHHHARRFYAPVAVVAHPEVADGEVDVTRGRMFALNDTAETVEGNLLVEYWTYDGEIVSAETKRVTLPPGSSTEVGNFHTLTTNHYALTTFLVMTLKTPHGEFQNDWHFGKYKDLPLAMAKVDAAVGRAAPCAPQITLSTDKPAFFVWANVCGAKGEFSDNSLTLLPGRHRTLTWNAKGVAAPLPDFASSLSVTHLRRTY